MNVLLRIVVDGRTGAGVMVGKQVAEDAGTRLLTQLRAPSYHRRVAPEVTCLRRCSDVVLFNAFQLTLHWR